jgi:hypothetical protein
VKWYSVLKSHNVEFKLSEEEEEEIEAEEEVIAPEEAEIKQNS